MVKILREGGFKRIILAVGGFLNQYRLERRQFQNNILLDP